MITLLAAFGAIVMVYYHSRSSSRASGCVTSVRLSNTRK